MLSIKQDQFYENDKPFFYLADTCWSAFTNITLDEWQYYLDYRANQGFNVIQINILSQWDASAAPFELLPFPITHNKNRYSFDYSRLNPEYFDRAEKMLQMVREHNMVPALVLLWSNYVPGTWANDIAINNHFVYGELENYVSFVTEKFKRFNPVYFVSGDTDFSTAKTISYYEKVLQVAKRHDPDALYSFHIKGRLAEIPEQFLSGIDFFSYQSGHNLTGQKTAYTIPLELRKKGFTRPIINTEPCYEQISYSRNIYGRYSARDVRQASWSSVLSGAGAGITYGAHGIWSWHRSGYKFGIVEGEGFDIPFDWRDALHFDGANDITYLKTIISSLFTNGIDPVDISLKGEMSIRVGVDIKKKRYIIYLPTNTVIDVAKLGLKKENSHAQVFYLDEKTVHPLEYSDKTILRMSHAEADSVIVLDKEE
ncbi:DUF4038 domain-containing protein [Lactobacillus sp. UCMA15818]|uniref:apiosidase-like domain-containing protein n=1 Tax=Lactobacillaceae TaxID=33958 RepID=UPI0025B24894|nr:DUF4038 domain-containing protein [Lactobacillus sp. UCMA15818]MDN2452168.1 DUF4038 domain-containing protein [Lactobacillus sp. UCMA15818]